MTNDLATVEAEIQSIEPMIADRSSEYWSGPRSSELKARYRNAVALRDQVPTGDARFDEQVERGLAFRTSTDARREFEATPEGRELAAQWDAGGGFALHLQQAQAVVARVMDSLETQEDRASLFQSFDRLPQAVQMAVYTDMTLGRPVVWRDAPEQAVNHFSTTPEGAALVREWGGAAARNVAVIRQRFERVVAQLGDDADAFLDWYGGLTSAQAKAVLEVLVR